MDYLESEWLLAAWQLTRETKPIAANQSPDPNLGTFSSDDKSDKSETNLRSSAEDSSTSENKENLHQETRGSSDQNLESEKLTSTTEDETQKIKIKIETEKECGNDNWTGSSPNLNSKNNKNKIFDEWAECKSRIIANHYPTQPIAKAAES